MATVHSDAPGRARDYGRTLVPCEARGSQRQRPRPTSRPNPRRRRRLLRGYAFDPSLATQLETALVSEITFKVPWEPLEPGPVGEYLEVVDFDPASGCFYAPVDLDHPTCWRRTASRRRRATRSSTSRWSTRWR